MECSFNMDKVNEMIIRKTFNLCAYDIKFPKIGEVNVYLSADKREPLTREEENRFKEIYSRSTNKEYNFRCYCHFESRVLACILGHPEALIDFYIYGEELSIEPPIWIKKTLNQWFDDRDYNHVCPVASYPILESFLLRLRKYYCDMRVFHHNTEAEWELDYQKMRKRGIVF